MVKSLSSNPAQIENWCAMQCSIKFALSNFDAICYGLGNIVMLKSDAPNAPPSIPLLHPFAKTTLRPHGSVFGTTFICVAPVRFRVFFLRKYINEVYFSSGGAGFFVSKTPNRYIDQATHYVLLVSNA